MKDTIKKIETLLPKIRERRAEVEQTRHLPADLAKSLQDTGVYSLSVPKAFGGQQVPHADLLRAIEAVATADGSTGWCAMIGQGIPAGFMDELGAKTVFADPTAPVAGVAGPMGQATRVDGGVRVTGVWAPASGITHSNWVWGGAMVFDNGAPVMTPHGPDIIHIFAPRDDVEVRDTWHVSGLCGTGSNEFRATDLFVPEHLVWKLFDKSGHRPEPLYQMPSIVSFATTVASVSLGIARAALDEVTTLAETRKPPLSMEPLADKGYAHMEISRAEVALRSARSFMFDIVDEIWATLSAGDVFTPKQNALGRTAATNVVETAARVAQTAARLGGSTALYNASSLQRHARDAEAITHHFVMGQDTWEQAGRVLLGRPITTPMF